MLNVTICKDVILMQNKTIKIIIEVCEFLNMQYYNKI